MDPWGRLPSDPNHDLAERDFPYRSLGEPLRSSFPFFYPQISCEIFDIFRHGVVPESPTFGCPIMPKICIQKSRDDLPLSRIPIVISHPEREMRPKAF